MYVHISNIYYVFTVGIVKHSVFSKLYLILIIISVNYHSAYS